MRELAWRTDEPCPLCGTGLFILEGLSGWSCECRLCGYGAILTADETPDGGEW
jgi:hypothetical protein